jgi:hypothetical protein
MKINDINRRCSQCEKKLNGCSTWENQTKDKTPSGWDMNRFAIYCNEFKKGVKK